VTTIFTFLSQKAGTSAVGTAYVNMRRTTLTTSFSYQSDYLEKRTSYSIDPELPLAEGTGARTLLRAGLPGAFSDAAPDRWGRNMVAKRIRADEKDDGRTSRSITDVDYLLGVSDETRQGALRFKLDSQGDFLHPEIGVPRLIALPQLMRAAEKVAAADPDEMAAIKMLLAAGTGSLGGARPKASVKDGDDLLIAKFTHPSDEWSVIAWEKTALDLAEAAGVTVPKSELVHVEGRPVLLLSRFDRQNDIRIGYMSAMTLLQARDGETRDYTELAEALSDESANTSSDLQQLWRRIAFSIAMHNTDDHLRNHGFLHNSGGWTLSPAFDINPDPDLSAVRVTSVGGSSDLESDIRGLMSYSETFGLSQKQAQAIVREVVDAAKGYPSVARTNSVPDGEIARFAPTLDATIGALSTAG
jgi:serine/threonine-protein kinase HipA